MAFEKLLVNEGDDNTIRQALRKDFNQIITKGSLLVTQSIHIDLDVVIDSLLDLAHRYSVLLVNNPDGLGIER